MYSDVISQGMVPPKLHLKDIILTNCNKKIHKKVSYEKGIKNSKLDPFWLLGIYYELCAKPNKSNYVDDQTAMVVLWLTDYFVMIKKVR